MSVRFYSDQPAKNGASAIVESIFIQKIARGMRRDMVLQRARIELLLVFRHSHSKQIAPASFAESLSGPGYRVHRLGFGLVGSVVAGLSSALLGIGGGLVKVPSMHLIMGVPLRVATATSNLMIGITAAASAVIYAIHGGIDVFVAGPTAIGVFVGATAGSRFGHRVDLRYLRWLFVIVLVYTAVQMLLRLVNGA